MEFNDKEIEYLERIVSADSRYLDNREWLEEMNEKNRTGHPAVVWSEALILADTIENAEQFRDEVARGGIKKKVGKRHAVRMMAVYILDNPTEHRTYTFFEDEEITQQSTEKKGYYSESVLQECMVAECAAVSFIKKRALKRVIKELIDISSDFGMTTLTIVLALIQIFNKEVGGLDAEEETVLNLINKKQSEMIAVRKHLKDGESIFSEKEVESSGILKRKRMLLEMMYNMTRGDYRIDNKEISDEDLCVSFFAVLKSSDEYDQIGYDVFFGMMKNLMKIEFSDKEISRIKRYIQNNGVDYNNWLDWPRKRYIRKKIANDLIYLFNQKKKLILFQK